MINIFNWVINDAVNCVTVVWLHRIRRRFVYWVTNIVDGNRKQEKSLPKKIPEFLKFFFNVLQRTQSNDHFLNCYFVTFN